METSKAPVARCLRVAKNNVELGRGRVVDVGPSKIVMYRKLTDPVLFVPLDVSNVEDVSVE